jgi:hypothetical protein
MYMLVVIGAVIFTVVAAVLFALTKQDPDTLEITARPWAQKAHRELTASRKWKRRTA